MKAISVRITEEDWERLNDKRVHGESMSGAIRRLLGLPRLRPAKRGRPKGWRDQSLARRNAEIISRLLFDPYLREEDVAADCGISRQRVSHILKENGIVRPQARRRMLRCPRGCGASVKREILAVHVEAHRTRFPAKHGSRSMYEHHGCRCDPCREANRREHQKLRGRVPPRHGESGYVNYGCRCDVCKSAGADWNRRRRQRSLTKAA